MATVKVLGRTVGHGLVVAAQVLVYATASSLRWIADHVPLLHGTQKSGRDLKLEERRRRKELRKQARGTRRAA